MLVLPQNKCNLILLAGKSSFVDYLQFRLSRQRKPFLVCKYTTSHSSWPDARLYCGDGIWNISHKKFEWELLTSPALRDIPIICDANRYEKLPYVEDETFAGSLIFITSPKLSNIRKELESNLQGRVSYFVMNPWTMFEMELM